MKKILILLYLTSCLGCSTARRQTVAVSLVNGGLNLKLTGLDQQVLEEINRDSVTTGWQSLIPVYKMPADTDLKDYQPPQPGKYSISGNAVIFTPDTPFAKTQIYFVRWFHYDKGNTMLDYIKNGKKLGKSPYTDLIFKRQ